MAEFKVDGIEVGSLIGEVKHTRELITPPTMSKINTRIKGGVINVPIQMSYCAEDGAKLLRDVLSSWGGWSKEISFIIDTPLRRILRRAKDERAKYEEKLARFLLEK